MPEATLAEKLSGISENQLHQRLADDLSTLTTPELHPLRPESAETCDRCGTGTLALFRVILRSLPPGKDTLTLCGHHSRPFGYNPRTHKTYLTEENKQKGSDH